MLILCYCHRRGVESASGRAIVIAREDLTTLFFCTSGTRCVPFRVPSDTSVEVEFMFLFCLRYRPSGGYSPPTPEEGLKFTLESR